MNPLMKKNSGIRNVMNNEEQTEDSMPMPKLMIWWKTTSIMVNPRKASMYSMRPVADMAKSVLPQKYVFSAEKQNNPETLLYLYTPD